MKFVVFAGGSGKRFWPLSRNKFPKQFQPIIDNKSTIELMVGRIAEVYGWDSLYVPTTKILVDLIGKHLPNIPSSNVFTEPVRRDLGAAVGYAMIRLRKAGFGNEPVAILWSDNFPANGKAFQDSLKAAEELVKIDPDRIIFLGEKPTFANDNLGWIELGEKIDEKNGISAFKKQNFKYRPSVEQATEWFNSDNFVWNTGYFVSTPNFVLQQYEKQNPKMYEQLVQIENAIGSDREESTVNEIYPQIEETHFDNVVLEGLDNKQAVVLKTDFRWSDPGTLYALKQFLQESEEANVTKGNIYAYKTTDSLIYNFIDSQIVTTVGLNGFVVVNTADAVLVCHKDQIGEIKKMLEEWNGTDNEKYM
jgi:mannose-1-phosphate guanylyltransferase